MDVSVVNPHAIYKVLYPKGIELLDFKIALAKSLIGTYHSRSWNTLVTHVSCRYYFQLVSHFTYRFFKQREENVDTAMLEGLKTKHTFNVIHVEFFCAWFPAIDLEIVLQIFIPKFKDNKNLFCCYSFISILSFTLGYLISNFLFESVMH